MSKNGSEMSHVDDGRLNALLDGELGAEEAAAVEAHIAACPECARRLAEARRFLTEASDLLGALELPGTAAATQPPERSVPKTAREIAVDLDGSTQRSPAIRPNLVGETSRRGFGRPPARRRLDFTRLAWAATVILAIGVGFLANEVRHSRERIAFGEGAAGRPLALQGTPPAAAANEEAASVPEGAGTAPRSAARREATPQQGSAAPSAPRATGAQRSAPITHGRRPAAPQAAVPPAADLARKETPALQGKLLAANAPSGQAGAARPPARAAKGLAAGGVAATESLAAPAVVAEASAPAPAADRARAAAARAAPTGEPAAGFRPADLEEAVARLGGTIRLIDGMRIEQVEVAPGSSVPGAARDLYVVRISYVDDEGRHVVLDQQRLGQPTDTSLAERRQEDIGMQYGDTVISELPGGQVRVRWVDQGRFWLSLTATLPSDTARALVARVR
jgi:anti-sigma factor RsiW